MILPESGEALWEPRVYADLAGLEHELENAEGADAEDSDGDAGTPDCNDQKLEVILEEPPEDLEICSATPAGLGALVKHCTGKAAQAGMRPGTAILAINARSVEQVPTDEIRSCLHEAPLPVSLDVKPMINLPKAKKMKVRTKDPVTVCTAHCRGSYRAVQAAIAELGWREVPSENRECSVVWIEHGDSSEGISPAQTVSRLDAFLHMCRKAPLAKCLNSWIDELPDDFTFVPETWVLPYDLADLESTMSRGKCTYIAKPSTGTQGKGIVLAKKFNDLSDVVSKAQGAKDGSLRTEYVVQRYVARPLLLDGLKFDMRIYVVVTSIVPLRAYLFKEGLARFCTVPYQAPKDGNLKDVCMHLTNFAVNKQSKDFQTSEGLENHDEGSKRSVSSVFWEIERLHGVSVGELWGKIASLTANTLMALRPGLLEHYVQQELGKKSRALHPLAPKGLQIIGLDVLLDSDLEPQLIELNANPSLSILQPGRRDPPDRTAAAEVLASADLPKEHAAGSALQAVRMTSRSNSPKMNSTSTLPSSAPLESNSSDDFDPQTAILRIASKLHRLSAEDIAEVEAFVDSLMPAAAGQPRKTASERSSQSPKGLADAAAEPRAARQTCATPDIASVSTAASLEGARQSSNSPGPTVNSGTGDRGRSSLRMQSRQRLGLSKSGTQDKPPKESKMVTSPLDLAIKKQLIAQALLLAKPAPQAKVSRLRKQWFSEDQDCAEAIPLDDEGEWVRTDLPADARPEVRLDAPERCPCLEELDFEALVIPDVREYARAHFDLYRSWVKSCGPGQSTLGQAQMLKLLERRGFVGPGLLFGERLAAQLWLTKVWRVAAESAFGLDLGQFVRLASRLGLLLRGEDEKDGADIDKVAVGGVLEFVRAGGAGAD